MDVASVAVVVAALGVNLGWQPADELPPTPIAAKCDAKASAERIFRGQAESPLVHTARFQSEDGWSGDRYAPTTASGSRQFDQRGATIGVEPIRTAQASPWSLDSAQQAATDAGNSLRDSVNSGVEQTQQQFNQGGQQLLDGVQGAGRDAQDAGRDFGQQLQNMSGFGNQSSLPPASSASRSSQSNWPAPPPLASAPQSTAAQSPGLQSSAPANRTTTPAAWSSIQPQLAPPRLLTPPMTNTPRVASNPSTGRATSGPTFPPPSSSIAPPLHSVLSNPATNSHPAADQDWTSVWGTSPASNTAVRDTASSDNDAGMGLVPVPPRTRPATTNAGQPQSPAFGSDARGMWPASPVDDRYSQPTAPAPAANSAADAWANFGQSQDNQFQNVPSQPQAPVATIPQNQPLAQQGPINHPAISTQPLATQQASQSANAEEMPWKPLLAVCLALAGSLGANLFLGMSYAEARHRYRALVAKTTHSFQKAAGIAA